MLSSIDTTPSPPSTPKAIPLSTMTLRDRTKKSVAPEQQFSSDKPRSQRTSKSTTGNLTKEERGVPTFSDNSSDNHTEGSVVKKLPRVLLRVNPPPDS